MSKNKIDWDAPTVAPIVGKRGRMRNGRITGVFYKDERRDPYIFYDNWATWTLNGHVWAGEAKRPNDIIAIVEGQPDIFNIEKPFGLLDSATQEALKDWYEAGKGIEIYYGFGWEQFNPHWHPSNVYRAIPAPESKAEPIEIQLEDCSDEVLEMLHKSGQLPEGRYDEEKRRRSGK